MAKVMKIKSTFAIPDQYMIIKTAFVIAGNGCRKWRRHNIQN